MNYKEYELFATTDKRYHSDIAIPYVVIGLCGELGEVYEKLQSESCIEEIAKECGDIMWYLACLREELGLSIEEDWSWNENVSMPTPFELPTEIGKIAEQVKKYLRDEWKGDEKIVFPEARKEMIVEAWKSSWNYLAGLVTSMGITLEEVAEMNKKKLTSRVDRGVIGGAGDNR